MRPPSPPDRATAEALLAHARERLTARLGSPAGRLPRGVLVVSRLAALCAFAFYVHLALVRGGRALIALPALAILAGIVCFPEIAGRYTGRIGINGFIAAPTNTWLALIYGWVLLLMPIWLGLLARAMG